MNLEPFKRGLARAAHSAAALWRRALTATRRLAARARPHLHRIATSERTWHVLADLRDGVFFVGRSVMSASRTVLAAFALAALLLAPIFLLTKRVHAGLIGVQQAQWGGAGVVARDVGPGLWFSLRGWHTWHMLDARTHYLAFGYATDGADRPILDLRTRDGNVVKVAVTVPYRIRPGEGHLIVSEGLKTAYPDMVRAAAQNLLVRELAELTSSDFASTDLRRERMDLALPRLNQALRPLHVEADTIQIHQVFFWMSYEEKLQAVQLTRQSALLATAVTQVEEEKRADLIAEEIVAEEKRIRAEMNLDAERLRAAATTRMAAIRRDAESDAVRMRAEADALFQVEVAAGRLAIDEADALRDELVQAALETDGGRLWLAREAARKLHIRSVTLNSSDPDVPSVLDLDEMVRLLVGQPRSAGD